MKLFKMKYFLLLTVFFVPGLAAMSQGYTLERYNHDRHSQAVEEIVRQNPDFLVVPGKSIQQGVDYALKCCACKNPDITTMVLREGDKTVGFINYAVTNINLFWCQKLTMGGHINLLGVNKDYLRKGYGKILVEHALKDLEKFAATITLVVIEQNTTAQSLYEKVGFTPLVPNKTLWQYHHCSACPERDAFLADQKQQLKNKAKIAGVGVGTLVATYLGLKLYKRLTQ